VSVTFDNLGEAMDLAVGAWPPDAPVGRHYSVTEVLPKVLDLLDGQGVRCTYFAEGWSAAVYPAALRALTERGHEVAYHGWRHEPWAGLDPATERELLARGVEAFDALGLRPLSFRPPGGDLTPASLGLLRELGFRYVSPVGDEVVEAEGLTVVPFRWQLVDAWYYLPSFGGPDDPSALRAAVTEALDGGGDATLIFHPFLTGSDERFSVLRETLERL
jgi:peptidoglycan/xylan/chitin deacetylase (PgdA/CDA1 family)